jgi:hypothetical protein
MGRNKMDALGEEITPAELFLSVVASCGVELVQVLTKSAAIPLQGIEDKINGLIDRSKPVRSDISLFNSVYLQFRMKESLTRAHKELVDKFKSRRIQPNKIPSSRAPASPDRNDQPTKACQHQKRILWMTNEPVEALLDHPRRLKT